MRLRTFAWLVLMMVVLTAVIRPTRPPVYRVEVRCLLDAEGNVAAAQIDRFAVGDPRAQAVLAEVRRYSYRSLEFGVPSLPSSILVPVVVWYDRAGRWQARVIIPVVDPDQTQRLMHTAGTWPVPVFFVVVSTKGRGHDTLSGSYSHLAYAPSSQSPTSNPPPSGKIRVRPPHLG